MIFEWDDFGANHVISDKCETHDCRDKLNQLKQIHKDFKCTLFAVPGEMTKELLLWVTVNSDWVELAVHGFYHTSNYECEKLTYEQFDILMASFETLITNNFQKIFRAPGWQISTEALQWLADNDWIVADQGYNDERRPNTMKAYINYDGKFMIKRRTNDPERVQAYHGHTWDVGAKGNAPNGIYEDFATVTALLGEVQEFKFLSEHFA